MRAYMPYVHRRASLRGWWSWLFALAPLCAVVTFDTWLNTENLRNDYGIAGLNKQLKELQETLDGLKVKEASLEALDRIEIEAPDLGLIEPQPDQVQVIYSPYPLGAPATGQAGNELAGEDGELTFSSEVGLLIKGYLLSKGVGETSWETNSASNLASTTPRAEALRARAGDLPRKATSSDSASSVGDS